MSVLVVGLSHRTADLDTLERAAVTVAELPKMLHELQRVADVDEVMLLSTCNRIEVYAVVETFHGGLSAVTEVLATKAGMAPEDLYHSLYVHYAAAAVEHIFSVASGLDSMVLGETQILGQVRTAYGQARDADTVGETLHQLIQSTLRVGKRVHSETELGVLGASVVSEALAGAGTELRGRSALIVGAGSMGALAASQLRKAGVSSVTVANRTLDRARRLAEPFEEAAAIGMDQLERALAEVDIAVCCTGAQDVVVTPAHVAPRPDDRPLVICDLGLPRDVDHDVATISGVRIVDLETVRRRMDQPSTGDTSTARETARASGIVLDEVRAYLTSQRTAEVTPTVTALRKQAADVVDAELLRLERRLPGMDDAARGEVAQTVRRVVDKLLHAPTVRVKQLAEKPAKVDYAVALRELFGLDPTAPAVVSSPAAQPPKHEQIETRQGDGE